MSTQVSACMSPEWIVVVADFERWLSNAGKGPLALWRRRAKATDLSQSEGAVAEALVWKFLTDQGQDVRLFDRLNQGGPDFEIQCGQSRALIEVTNISVSAATRATGMVDRIPHNGGYGMLTVPLQRKVRKKVEQATGDHGLPVLIWVTTLHWNASRHCDRLAVEWAMTSSPQLSQDLEAESLEPVGDLNESTDLANAVFLFQDRRLPIVTVEAGFGAISGFVLAGLGLYPYSSRFYGGLNPIAVHQFDTVMLPTIPFCRVAPWPTSDSIGLNWSSD